jgi:hypothetical protein
VWEGCVDWTLPPTSSAGGGSRSPYCNFFVCASVFLKPFSEQIKLFANRIFKSHCVDCFARLFHVQLVVSKSKQRICSIACDRKKLKLELGVATRCGLDCPAIESRWGGDFPQPSRPDPVQSRSLPDYKATGAWRRSPTLSTSRLKKE